MIDKNKIISHLKTYVKAFIAVFYVIIFVVLVDYGFELMSAKSSFSNWIGLITIVVAFTTTWIIIREWWKKIGKALVYNLFHK